MTIKEMEERSGLARANIRFYEAEGLFTPERKPNGYRNYSGADLTTLLRVRLLRALGVSLEDIKAIQAGDLPLPEALGRHLAQLAGEQDRLTRAEGVCREMREAGEDYDHLDAAKYLEELEREPDRPAPVPETDAIPKIQAPWRRYFARSLDGGLYCLVLNGILLAVGANRFVYVYGADSKGLFLILGVSILSGLLLMLFLEPPLLHWFGTTPGKALMGLHVQDPDGGRLTNDQAFLRTGGVLVHGMGLNIPVLDLVREYRSYEACNRGETLPWEKDSVLVLRKPRAWRTAVFVILYAAVFLAGLGQEFQAQLPANRGDLTVAEFCENFNRQAEIMGYTRARLEPDGTWKPVERYGSIILEDEIAPDLPKLNFIQEDGVLTGLSYTVAGEGQKYYFSWGQKETALALWAFVGAQRDCGILHRDLNARYDDLVKNPIHSVDNTLYGVRVKCDAQWMGEPGPYLAQEGNTPASFLMTVWMKKQ